MWRVWLREPTCRWAEFTAEPCTASCCRTSQATRSRSSWISTKSTHEIIKQDSVASIETEGLLGNQYVAISFGSAGQAEVKNGETIQSVPPLEMADLLKKTSGILDSSQQAIHNATLATAHLNSVSAKIDSGQGTVGALVNDKQLYNNLEQTTATLHAHDAAGAGRSDGLPGEYGSPET